MTTIPQEHIHMIQTLGMKKAMMVMVEGGPAILTLTTEHDFEIAQEGEFLKHEIRGSHILPEFWNGPGTYILSLAFINHKICSKDCQNCDGKGVVRMILNPYYVPHRLILATLAAVPIFYLVLVHPHDPDRYVVQKVILTESIMVNAADALLTSEKVMAENSGKTPPGWGSAHSLYFQISREDIERFLETPACRTKRIEPHDYEHELPFLWGAN